MSIITISRGSFSQGKDVAEKLAANLNYECISRDILLEASEEFNVPEIKLTRAIHDAPSILRRLTIAKDSYIAYVRSALLRHVRKDNVVYHGLAGHFFLQNIPHVLKVRIIVAFEGRVKEEINREHISAEEACKLIMKDDEERRRWGLSLYGKDTLDASLYDMVLNIQNMTVGDAVNVISSTIKLPRFQTTPASQKKIDDLALAAYVQAILIEEMGLAEVEANDGMISVRLSAPTFMQREMALRIDKAVSKIAEVKKAVVTVSPPK